MDLDTTLQWAMPGVQQEIRRSMKEHPKVSDDLLRATCVIVEEAGEALKDAMNCTRFSHIDKAALKLELRQTAASAIRLLAKLESECNP